MIIQPSEADIVRADAINIAVTAAARIARLESDLAECRDFLEKQIDVLDGSYGHPVPNEAMRLVQMIDETMHGAGAF